MRRPELGPLRHRNYRYLWLGTLTSFAGSAIAPIALAFAVLEELGGSATALGLVLAAGWVPQILFVLVGGVVADRIPRSVVMVGANLLSGVAQAVAAVLVLTGEAEIWHLAALNVLRGTATSFYFPAEQGLLPQTVPAHQLQNANALMRLTISTTTIAGAAVGGAIVAAAGPGWGLAADAASYFAAAAVLTLVHAGPAVREAATSAIDDLREGWDAFRSRRWLWVIVLGAAVGNVAGTTSAVLGPIVALEDLGGAKAWGIIAAASAAGSLVGGVVAFRLRPRRILFGPTAALMLTALPLAALAVPLPLAAIAVFSLVAAVGVQVFSVFWSLALQQHIPGEMLSRVSSYDALGSFVLIPLGQIMIGPIADAIGVGPALWAMTALAVAAVGVPLLVRDVRALERTDVAPAA